MRCHITECNDEAISPPNIWTSGSLPSPNVCKTILNPNSSDYHPTDDLYKFDSSSSSQKRKLLLEGEHEDFEEQFYKIQRKKQLQKVAAQASLVVEDDDDSDSDEERIYQQMEWLGKQNGFTLSYDSSSDEDDDSFSDDKDYTSFEPHSKWKEDRRRLLNISMAKINDVEDPEAYLWRSVLINNTVRRLQGDDTTNYQCDSMSTYFQGNDLKNDILSNRVIHEKTDMVALNDRYKALPNNNLGASSCPVGLNEAPSSFDFPLVSASLPSEGNKTTFNAIHHKVLQNSSVFYDRSVFGEQTLNESSLTLVSKSQSSLHTFSSQSCGLQYKNPIHTEENKTEYRESTSSILDSVVYHSLMASIET
ncbi:hypothetical protein JTE90_012371 [Oedothorax gibbosus]|uniref:SERTA domain-containing protein n=1 Tax=Oedothorax gibbosus TaxID=931172 RepID=A0AAV6URI9_9ARAC|nr:hypothetical protein JTE90_012371 [Oedothorax gibbosus]